MSKIISIHSFRGGTGKSNTTANLATLAAMDGLRVGVVDADVQSPGIHVLFRLNTESMNYSLNDFLWGRCDISQSAHEVSKNLNIPGKGRLFLIPSSIQAGDLARVLQYGYDVKLLREGFQTLITELNLDLLMVDTHPGLNEETLLSIAISDILVVLLRPDQQDYQGTAVTLEVSRHLEVPKILLVVNKVPATYDLEETRRKVAEAYHCEIAGVLPHSDDLMAFASDGIFVLNHPKHPITDAFRQINANL